MNLLGKVIVGLGLTLLGTAIFAAERDEWSEYFKVETIKVEGDSIYFKTSPNIANAAQVHRSCTATLSDGWFRLDNLVSATTNFQSVLLMTSTNLNYRLRVRFPLKTTSCTLAKKWTADIRAMELDIQN